MKLTAKRLDILCALGTYGMHGATAADIGADCLQDHRWARDGLSALVSYAGYATTRGSGPYGSTIYVITDAGRQALNQKDKSDD